MTLKTIREGKFSKIVASYLAIQLFLQMAQPMQLFALTSGPSQPEFNSFTPIGTSDMVSLSSGDFSYNIPIMDVGGYPLNLAYQSGVSMDQEASWVGLGWNMNVGQIARNVRGIPDDFKGDEMRYENDLKENETLGSSFGVSAGVFGVDILDGSVGLNVQYSNYTGMTFSPNFGVSYAMNDNTASLGLNISSSTAESATISPNVRVSREGKLREDWTVNKVGGNVGIGLNSRKGAENMSMGFSRERIEKGLYFNNLFDFGIVTTGSAGGGGGGNISFNDQTDFTPSKRVGMDNGSFTFNGSLGPSVFGGQVQGQLTGYRTRQKIRASEKDKRIPAFGFEHTEKGELTNGVLDFNREKDRTFSKNTTVLPVTNYTYDSYVIQGQGVGGSFRPYRSQMSYLYDNKVVDYGDSETFGAEVGTATDFYAGAEIKLTTTTSYTGKWETNNYAINQFKEFPDDANPIQYEPVYFKQIGEMNVDKELSIYEEDVFSEKPFRLTIDGNDFNKSLRPIFKVKETNSGVVSMVEQPELTNKIKRTERFERNQSILNINNTEALQDPLVAQHSLAQPHHTVGVKIWKPDGSRYVFGEAAYNTKKVEATFDVSGQSTSNCATGLISYSGDAYGNSSARSNQFLNRITTPSYAHTYLLSAVLSADYSDLTGDGLSLDDLGAYTKFTYDTYNNYQWRIPYKENNVMYNEGLKSNPDDQTGNYIYGNKELKYINKIETKTHTAVFELSDREDALGVKGEAGGKDLSLPRMKQLDRVFLFSRPEFERLTASQDFENIAYEEKATAAIKVAHFEYDYSQCPGVPNNSNAFFDGDNDGDNDNFGGKLTLKKVYFTYRGSNMGKYNPYEFNYGEYNEDEAIIDINENGDVSGNKNDLNAIPGDDDSLINPPYGIKSYDIWGNYKPNLNTGCGVTDPITAPEFPYVQQDRRALQDIYAKAWSLTSIELPSGGKMRINLESDDYGYVQDRKAMQMYKIAGVGDTNNPSETNVNNNRLYQGSNHIDFLYVALPNNDVLSAPNPEQAFLDEYIGNQYDKPIYFRFLMNMVRNSAEQFDYITGYFEIKQNANPVDSFKIFEHSGTTYASIGLKNLKRETKGGIASSNQNANPFSKSGWHFGRTHLNRAVYGNGEQYIEINNIEDFLEELQSSFQGIAELFKGPNGILQQKGCAQFIVPEKSWIRLLNPEQEKLGGGCRVQKIVLQDAWDTMTDSDSYYEQEYGQVYNYNLANNKTSGVASFEPNSSKENPLVEPFYDKEGDSYADRLASPQEENYIEKPIGESFYPAASVTYGRVTVKNLERKEFNSDGTLAREVKKHATGKVVNEFYTTKDFPTISDYTNLNQNAFDKTPDVLGLLKLNVKNHLTLSQGFSIVTNDMAGKIKRQSVLPEGQIEPISKVDYIYNISENDPKQLDNVFPTVNNDGQIESKIIGQSYDIVNDFRENYSRIRTSGVNANLTTFLAAIWPAIIPVPLPNSAVHQNILRTAVTTKVIHKSGILKEKIAYDLGSKVSTKNLAWDAQTGQVLLTETINEYDDNYYNFTYPSHWLNDYSGMDKAAINLGMEGMLNEVTGNPFFSVSGLNGDSVPSNLENIFELGDELFVYNGTTFRGKFWLVGFNSSSNALLLMDIDGNILNECGDDGQDFSFKVMRSGHRNQQMGSMASVTSIINPIADLDGDGQFDNLTPSTFAVNNASLGVNEARIVNASAVEYSDYWRPQVEYGLPGFLTENYFDSNGNFDPRDIRLNPYVYNIKGQWRAVSSYAYLTGRYANDQGAASSPRAEGFFSDFEPFYSLNTNGRWSAPDTTAENFKWTFASEVSQYSPYGAELENRDALYRYSAAQYGYNYTLPLAVASNSEYREVGYDGFEDYAYMSNVASHFGFHRFEADLSTQFSHTGATSLRVIPGATKGIRTNLQSCDFVPRQQPECDIEIDVTPPNGCNIFNEITLSINGLNEPKTYFYSFQYTADQNDCWENPVTYQINGSTSLLPTGQFTATPGTFSIDFGMTFSNGAPSYQDVIGKVFLYDATSSTDGITLGVGYDLGLFCDEEATGGVENPICGQGTTGGSNPNNGGGSGEVELCNSFRPQPVSTKDDGKYIVSAWVRENHATQMMNYNGAAIVIEGEDASGSQTFIENLTASGNIIDGWQRISAIITLPEETSFLNFSLTNAAAVDAYFDDVRIYPFNGNMKSFVYEPTNQRLVAELDENNYATFYEYDYEGGLIRVKKETERGVYTIQETRSGNSKITINN